MIVSTDPFKAIRYASPLRNNLLYW
jgi:hypothetical protein